MLSVFFFIVIEKIDSIRSRQFIDEFFQLEPFFRLVFAMSFMTFAAGCLIKIWQAKEINYIHIMQVDYDSRMNPYQLWSISSVLMFFFFIVSFISMTFIANVYENDTKENWKESDPDHPLTDKGMQQIKDFKRTIGIISCSVMLIIMLLPCIPFWKFRKGIL